MNQRTATPLQMEVASKLGIDVTSDTFAVAAARILDMVGPAIGDEVSRIAPTPKQVEYGRSLGIDISGDSYRVGCARLTDRLADLNRDAIEHMRLAPGDRVIDHTRLGGIQDVYVVSSIRDDGLVFFRGGQGRGAWAMKLEKVG